MSIVQLRKINKRIVLCIYSVTCVTDILYTLFVTFIISVVFFQMNNLQFDGNISISTVESLRSTQEIDTTLNTTQYCFLHDDFFLVKGFQNLNLFVRTISGNV